MPWLTPTAILQRDSMIQLVQALTHWANPYTSASAKVQFLALPRTGDLALLSTRLVGWVEWVESAAIDSSSLLRKALLTCENYKPNFFCSYILYIV